MNWQILAGFTLLVLDGVLLHGLRDALSASLRQPVRTGIDRVEWFGAVALSLLLWLVYPGLAGYLLVLGHG